MNLDQLKNLVEAALLAYGQPLNMDQLRGLLDEADRPEAAAVREALEALASECAGRPVELVEVASGWRLQVRAEYAAPLSRLWQERPGRYSRALLETLALIAYRQPITRGEIENVRGVQVNPNIVRTLTERGWIRVVGHREVPGHPELLGTTREFLDYFGLKSLDELPSLAALKDMDDVGIQLEFADTVQAVAAGLPAANDSEAVV
jgi:segregation and condensation protein B